jgi:hypothetical protein
MSTISFRRVGIESAPGREAGLCALLGGRAPEQEMPNQSVTLGGFTERQAGVCALDELRAARPGTSIAVL